MATKKFTFKQFQSAYPDDDACLLAILKRRYGDIDCCPKCGIVGKLTRIQGRRAFACKGAIVDGKHKACHIYPCAGTVFEKSSTPLTLWFHAMYLMTATRNGVSAKELERQLGVTYKCAWRIGHQLRELMSARAKAQNPGPMSGHVEADETYLGGVRKGSRGKGESLKNKTVVFGVVQRGGPVFAKIVPNEKKTTLTPILIDKVMPGTILSTDTHRSHKRLSKQDFIHGMVDHKAEQWVNGTHHTQTIEGFWKHLKCAIKSTHISVSKQHAQKYIDEFGFRFNNRHAPADMFKRMLAQISKPICP